MNKNHQKLKKTSCKKNKSINSKTSITALIQMLLILLFVTACTNTEKPNKAVNDKEEKEELGEVYTNFINLSKKKSHQKTDYEEFIKNQKSWDELKSILANDIVSAKELGIVACSAFKRPPVEIELQNPFKAWRLKQQNESWILNTFYKWNTYELDGKDLCIEMIEPKHEYLSLLDSQILISANKNHHFSSLNLESSITYKEINYTKSSDSDCDYYEIVFGAINYSLGGNDCLKEKILVNNNIPLKIIKQHTSNKSKGQNEVENFTNMLFELIKCGLWPDKGFKQNKNYQPIEYKLNYSNNEAPPLCIQNTNNIVLNENKNIELYFTTKILTQGVHSGGYLSKFKTQTESIRKKMLQNQVDILLFKLGLFTKNNKYNYGLIDEAIALFKSRQEGRKKYAGFKQRSGHGIKLDKNPKKYTIIKNPKSKIIVYIKFLYGEGANYYTKYDLDRNLTVVKLESKTTI